MLNSGAVTPTSAVLHFFGVPSGIPDASAHVCQGNYAVGKDYDGQIGHRYFDAGRYKADPVCKIGTTSYLIERDMTEHYHAGSPKT